MNHYYREHGNNTGEIQFLYLFHINSPAYKITPFMDVFY